MSGVIFDLDGTLVDSAPDIHAAANAALSDEGVPGLTLAEARDCVGHGAAVFVSRAMALRGLGEDPARHRRILDGFLGRYEAAVHLTQPFALFTEGYRKTPVEALAHDARFAAFAELPPLVARLVPAPG